MKKKSVSIAICTFVLSAFHVVGANPVVLPTTDSQQFPFTMVGQLIFRSGGDDFQGSGTLINKRSVITAAHNLWDEVGGFSVDIEFNRGRQGAEMLSQDVAERKFIFAGYRSAVHTNGSDSTLAFARDIGGLRFSEPVADGSYVGWKAQPSLLTGDGYNIAVGYGAEVHSGDDPLYVEPDGGFEAVRGAFFENYGITFEAGMSGGPVLMELQPNDWRVVGVIVAGTDDPDPSGGIRVLNSSSATFIRTYLRF